MIGPYRRQPRPWRWTPRRLVALLAGVVVLVALVIGGIVGLSIAQGSDCAASAPQDVHVAADRVAASSLAGHPVAAVAAGPDVVFVSLHEWSSGDRNGIEVLRRSPAGLRSEAVIRLRSGASGLAISPDGRLLLAAEGDGVVALDAARAAAGDPSSVLGFVSTGGGAGTSQLAVAGGRFVVTADETANRVSVLDLNRMESGDFGPAVRVGTIDMDMSPAGVGVSPDGRYAYVVSQVQGPVVHLGPSDFVYGLVTFLGLPRRAGTLTVIDTRNVELDPGTSVVARVPAGCGPVRVAAAPDGKTVWVTARRSNELLAFRTDDLLSGKPAEPVARVPVAAAPKGLQLVRNGGYALVAGSDRGGDSSSGQPVDVVDTAAALAGRPALRTAVAVGGMPQEIGLSPDQRVAYVADNGTSTLSAVDLAGLLGG